MPAKPKELTIQILVSSWFACALLICIQPFLRHLHYFQLGPNYRLVQTSPGILALVILVYLYIRRYRFWRVEPLLFCLPILAAILAQPKAMAVTFWIVIAAYSIGKWSTTWLSLETGETPVAVAAGFGVLILILYILGKLGLFYPSVFAGLLGLATIACIPFGKNLLGDVLQPYQTWRNSPELASPLTGLAIVFAILFMGCGILVMLTPATAWDVLYYHFPLASIYADHHALAPSSVIAQSYYPQGAEVLMTLAMTLGGQTAAQLVMPVFFILFLWILLRIARECGASLSAAFFAVVATATTPFLHWAGSVSKNDMAMTAFQLAALYAFLRWQKTDRFAWLIAGAFFCGQAFGIKHVALFGFLPLAVIFGYAILRQAKPLRSAVIFVSILTASGLFWQLETWVRKGNPVYPEQAKSAVQGAMQLHAGTEVGTLERLITLPGTIFFDGRAAFQEVQTPNPAGVLLVFLAPLPFLISPRRLNPAAKTCLFFTLLYFVYWASMMSTLRYAISPFALAVVGVAAALTTFFQRSRRWMQGVLLFVSYFSLVFGLFSVMTFETNTLQVKYLLHRVDREAFLVKMLPATGALFYLARLDPKAMVFGIDQCMRFYAPDPGSFRCVSEEELLGQPEAGTNGRPRYVVVSNGHPDFQGQILHDLSGMQVYEDHWSRAYKLQSPAK